MKVADMCGFERDDVPGRADYRKASEWLVAAANLGDPQASNNLGVLYECGLGVPADLDEALMHYRHAAMKNLRIAFSNMERLKVGQPPGSDQSDRWRHIRA